MMPISGVYFEILNSTFELKQKKLNMVRKGIVYGSSTA